MGWAEGEKGLEGDFVFRCRGAAECGESFRGLVLNPKP